MAASLNCLASFSSMFARKLFEEPYMKNAWISSTRPGDPLFDHFTTEIGVDLAFGGAARSLERGRIRDSLAPGEALKPPRFKDSHLTLFYGT